MKAIVRTVGIPPSIQTSAALNAPQGAIALAGIMEREDYADIVTIDLDWKGDGVTPAMTIYTVKFLPQYAPENLQHFWPIDINEAFGDDNMTNGILRDINEQLKNHFNEMVELRDRMEKNGTWKKPGEGVKYV